MSVSSQPVESFNWKPSISEIAELLQNLGISPPQSLDENFFATPPITWRNNSEFEDREESEILEYVSGSEATVHENFDREKTIEQLKIAREDGKSIECRNNYFHEYLVQHFKRKQMMHVYTNESEDDVLLNEYLRKLDELEKSNEDLVGSREEWDAELARTRADIRGKKRDAREAVEEIIGRERTVGASSWYCGKPLSVRRIQKLIERQLDRIKDIAKFRIRYTRLSDEFVAIEAELRHSELSRPNLTREDYERLEAEQFHYKRELAIKDKQLDEFREKRDRLVALISSKSRKIVKAKRGINHFEGILLTMRNSVRLSLEERKSCLAKLADARHFVREFNDIIGQTERPEFTKRMADIRGEHDEWMRKISRFLRDIENLGQSLNSLRANLMLHGKDLDGGVTIGNAEKSISHSAIEKNHGKALLQ